MRFRNPWSRKVKLSFVDRLETYISAGLPVNDSLGRAGDGSSLTLRLSIERIRMAVESGQALSVALAAEAGLSPALVGLIACGEASGDLGGSLQSARSILEREDELIKKCLSAMTYPLVIGIAAIALVVGLTQGIMPQIIPLLSSLRTELPLLTRAVMATSGAVSSYGLYMAGGLIGSAIGVSSAYRVFRPIRSAAHSGLLGLPILGSLAKRYVVTLFLRSFGSLVGSGMPSDLAYAKAASAISLIPIREMLVARSGVVRHGGRVSDALSDGLPSGVSPIVSAGEASGNLSGALLKASSVLDREMDHSLKRLTALIEPLMMIAVGLMVGAIALSIMMPIYDVSKTLQG